MKRIVVVLVAILLAAIVPARADYLIKDGNGVLKTIKAGTLAGSVILPYQVPVDASGLPFGSANPLSIMFGSGVLLPAYATPPHIICDSGCSTSGGSTGLDLSANAASIPANVDFILLATVPISSARVLVGVQNQSGATIQIVRDDGAGANQTSLFLSSTFSSWTSSSFKGRIRVYGISGSSIAAYQD